MDGKEDQYGSESTSGKMVRGIPGRTGTVTGAAERRAGVRDAVRTWRRYYTYKNLLDFSINVNPLGPADAVVEAAARSLQRIGEYPDSRSRELRNALAEKKGLEAERFVIGNGAADLLFSLVLAEKPQKAMIVIPAFSEYEQALKTVGCEILYHEVKKENNFRLGTDLTEKTHQNWISYFYALRRIRRDRQWKRSFLLK